MSKQDNEINAVEVMRSSQAWNGDVLEAYPTGEPELTVMRLATCPYVIALAYPSNAECGVYSFRHPDC